MDMTGTSGDFIFCAESLTNNILHFLTPGETCEVLDGLKRLSIKSDKFSVINIWSALKILASVIYPLKPQA